MMMMRSTALVLLLATLVSSYDLRGSVQLPEELSEVFESAEAEELRAQEEEDLPTYKRFLYGVDAYLHGVQRGIGFESGGGGGGSGGGGGKNTKDDRSDGKNPKGGKKDDKKMAKNDKKGGKKDGGKDMKGGGGGGGSK
ncbi:MAG: hypothetical protein SGILL_003288 [Bacillariaceae sp.]